MNPSRLFIERPIATTLLMVAVLLAGLVGYRALSVSALPQVDYPTIQVTTLYPGASPEIMATTITAPLERQFGQMPGLAQMASTSSGGASVIGLRFALDLTLDVAEQEVQAAINAATSFLPLDLPMPPVYSKVNPADAPILTLAISSATLPLPRVEDLVETRLVQKLSQVPGVGLVSVAGGQRPAVRVRINPTALAANGLALDDVRTAIGAANVNQAKGSFDGPLRASTIDANDQLRSPDEYRNLVLAWRNGAPIRLSDVAEVVDGTENAKLAAKALRKPYKPFLARGRCFPTYPPAGVRIGMTSMPPPALRRSRRNCKPQRPRRLNRNRSGANRRRQNPTRLRRLAPCSLRRRWPCGALSKRRMP